MVWARRADGDVNCNGLLHSVEKDPLRPGQQLADRIELAQLKRALLDPEDRVAWEHIDRIAFDRGLVGRDRHRHVRVAPKDFVEKALPRGIKVGHYYESHSRARRDILEQAAKRFDSACRSADAYYRETIGLRHVLGQRAVRPTPPSAVSSGRDLSRRSGQIRE